MAVAITPTARRRELETLRLSLRMSKTAMVGVAILVLILMSCIVVPLLWSYSPETLVGLPLTGPSLSHPFGTDELGRDVFVRVLEGGRIDLMIPVIAVTLAAVCGSLIGTTAALAGNWVDATLMRVADALIAFPFTILILAIVLVFGSTTSWGPLPAGLPAILFALVITDWAVYARLARAQTLTLRDRDFIVAAETLGFSFPRRVLRHLLPNVAGVVGAYMVTDAVLVILTVAALPFLGAGIQPPTPEWGSIMADGTQVVGRAWWLIVGPGLLLALTAIGLSLVADSLLDRSGGSR